MEFRLPDVGEGLDEAEIIEWLVQVGDEVTRDQPLVEILTDKSQAQLPSPTGGRVGRIGFLPGDRAKVGEILVVIDEIGGPVAQPVESQPIASRQRVKASPAVRKRAVTEGIDLTAVVATGPGGRVLASDLDAAIAVRSDTSIDVDVAASPAPAGAPAPAPAAAPAPVAANLRITTPSSGTGPAHLGVGVHPLRGIRRVTAQTMAASWSSIPHIHGFDEVDATELLATHRRVKEAAAEHGQRLTVLSLLLLAVADAVRSHPIYNASIDVEAEKITVHEHLHLGFAAATANGLVVPVVRDADRRGLLGLASEVERLTEAARSGLISAADLRGGTLTVTNFGSLGGRLATPIIRPPEVGIVGFGSVVERPIVVDGEVVARPTLPVSIGSDHRLIDGDVSTSFQEHLKRRLADPSLLLL